MQRTKLGVSVGMLGAIIYLTGLFGGLLIPVLITGCVLLSEENEWLRKSAVKAIAVIAFFAFLTTALNLIPDAIGTIHSVVAIFGGRFSIVAVSNIISAAVSILALIEKILLLALGIKALNQGNITIPVVDKLINRHMG